MNEELQEELVRRFTKRFQKYNERVLYELGQVIKEIGKVIPSDAYKLAQQLKYNTTVKDLEKELIKITGKSAEEVQQILEHIAKENIQFAKPYYEAKGLNVPIYEKHKELQKLVNSIANLSSNEFVNIARSTGFKLLDENKKPLLLDIKETYHKIIDEATYAVTTGKDSYNQLMRESLKQLASSGVRKIEYESGYSRRIDTAVRMNLMDSIRQVSNEVQRICGEEFGADGVEITVHEHPAPDHERCQGRQFSFEEFEKFQNYERCKDYKGNIYNPIENGKKRRQISEYNCYHNINQIVLGVSNPIYSDEKLQEIIDNNQKGVEIDGKHYTNYEATQLQRRIETEVRKAKEQQLLAESTGDEELTLKSQERVRQLKHKYIDISKRANMKIDTNRTYVPNYKEKKIKTLSYNNEEILKNANDVYNAYKENNNENLLVLDKAGNTLGKINTINSSSSVNYSEEQIELMKEHDRDLIAIHNHPHNHTFSLQDIKETFNNKALNGIIVTTEDYNYYFFPKISDMNMSDNQLKYFIDWLEDQLANSNDKMLKKFPKLSNNEHNHLSFEEIFERLEWKYGRQRKK